MMSMLVAVVVIGMVLTALYSFGVFNTPYMEAFRVGFYVLLLMVLVAIVLALGRHPFEGYDPTSAVPAP